MPRSTPPLHGYRGDTSVASIRPRGLTVAITREAGARGGSIARRLAEMLDWAVFDQDGLDQIAADDSARTELLYDVPPGAVVWADQQLESLIQAGRVPAETPTAAMARILFTLAARGDVIVVGRGAGFLLPAATTVHVRVVAPQRERVAYLADLLRLTPDEAHVEMTARDTSRLAFLSMIADRDTLDPAGYDLLLNSGRLGIETSAKLVATAVAARR